MRVFITVGTTEFDELMMAIDTSSFSTTLRSLNCTHLTLQIGRGQHVPRVLLDEITNHGILCSFFDFKATLSTDMVEADIIISHCGAGSILDALQLKKLLIVVINTTLQGNHQSELATAMYENKHCLRCTPETLITTLNQINSHGIEKVKSELIPYPDPDLDAFPALVDGMFNWS